MAKQPKNPFHPGEILLEEFLEPLGMSQTAFAEKVGWTEARLNELIRGKRGVTTEAALDLAEVSGTSPKLWMNFQATYDLDRAKRARAA
jgi:addiction module HigA family antidote